MPDPTSMYRSALLRGAPAIPVPETIGEIRDQLYGGNTRRMAAATGVSTRNLQRYIAGERHTAAEQRHPSPATAASIQDAAQAEARWQRLEPYAAGGGTIHCAATVRISRERRVISFPITYLDPGDLGIGLARAGDWEEAAGSALGEVASAYFSGGLFDPTSIDANVEFLDVHDITIDPAE